jgi:hypothetical protein
MRLSCLGATAGLWMGGGRGGFDSSTHLDNPCVQLLVALHLHQNLQPLKGRHRCTAPAAGGVQQSTRVREAGARHGIASGGPPWAVPAGSCGLL